MMPQKNRHASPLIVLALLIPPVLCGTAAMDVDVEEATPSGSEPELVTATKRVSRMINVKAATLHD